MTGLSSQRRMIIHPLAYTADSITTEAIKTLCLLLIQVVMLFISRSFQAVVVIATAICASMLADFVSSRLFEKNFTRNYSLLISAMNGCITGMLIPETIPPVAVFFTVLIAMLVVQHFFGGFAYAWANPAVFSVVILWIVGASLFPSWQVSLDTLAMRNASQVLIENGVFTTFAFDEGVTDFLNTRIFNLFKVSVPDGYVSLFWDTRSAIPAFRYNFITLLSSLVIFSEDIYKVVIPAMFVGVYALLVRFVSPIFTAGVMFQGDVLLCLLTGGTLFFAVFVLNWYGTVPVSLSGKLFYGAIIGIIAFLIAGPGTSPAGMTFTVLIANVFSILIQQWENRHDRILLRKKLELLRKQDALDAEGR